MFTLAALAHNVIVIFGKTHAKNVKDMKPSKKKNLQVKTSNDLSTPKIDSYFKVAAKQLNLDVNINAASDHSEEKAIYIDALKKKLQDLDGYDAVNDKNVDPVDESVAVNTIPEHNEGACGTSTPAQDTASDLCEPVKCFQCAAWKAKYDDLNKFCLKLAIRNANMDLKYDDLLRTKTCASRSVPGDAELSKDDFFTPKELRYLDVMSLEKKSDSTFVRHCLEFIYKENIHILKKKSLHGTAEKQLFSDDGLVDRVVEGKDPLTPSKVDKIRSMFVERISISGVGAVEYAERIKDSYLNRLIAASLQNISKKL